jgi:hypothetical protein
MSRYDEFVVRKITEYGTRFDPSELAPEFIRWFNSGDRIKVKNDEYVRTGTVGVTTGWRPAFLLMHRSSDHGSGDVLGPNDQVTAVRYGRQYRDV